MRPTRRKLTIWMVKWFIMSVLEDIPDNSIIMEPDVIRYMRRVLAAYHDNWCVDTHIKIIHQKINAAVSLRYHFAAKARNN